jgi:hypothetical protein
MWFLDTLPGVAGAVHIRSALLSTVLASVLAGACDARPGERGPSLWTIEPELRVGRIDGPDALGEVIAVQVGALSEILVVEWREGSVRVFDASGRSVRRIGRSGSGPGEFSQPGVMTWSGDTLVVSDPMLRRLQMFDASGTLVGTISPQPRALSGTVGPPAVAGRLADGTLLGNAFIASHLIQSGIVRDEPVVRMREDGTLLDTLAVVAVTNRQLSLPLGSAMLMTQQPVSDAPIWLAAYDGTGIIVVDRAVVAGEPALYRVTRIGVEGDTLFSRSYAYQPVPFDATLVDGVVDRLAERLGAGGHHPIEALRAAIREHAYLPSSLPPVTRVVAGRDGTLWIRREEMSDMVVWDVLDESGDELGNVMVPRDVTVHQASRELVWAVEKDELGVNYIVRYRVLR